MGHILWLVPNYLGMALIKIGGAKNETTKIGLVFPVTIICFYSLLQIYQFRKALIFQGTQIYKGLRVTKVNQYLSANSNKTNSFFLFFLV